MTRARAAYSKFLPPARSSRLGGSAMPVRIGEFHERPATPPGTPVEAALSALSHRRPMTFFQIQRATILARRDFGFSALRKALFALADEGRVSVALDGPAVAFTLRAEGV